MAESKGSDTKEQDPPTAEGEDEFEQDNGTLKWTTHKCGGDVPSPMHSWFADMLLRIDQLSSWSDELELPLVMWYPGLFNPMAFNTAVMQVSAAHVFS